LPPRRRWLTRASSSEAGFTRITSADHRIDPTDAPQRAWQRSRSLPLKHRSLWTRWMDIHVLRSGFIEYWQTVLWTREEPIPT
jgi:hypothetical protein